MASSFSKESKTMGQKLPDDQMRLYRRIDEALHFIWDPIGISRSAWARDEYQSYLPQIFSRVMQSSSRSELRDYLIGIEADHMGLGRSFGMKKRVENFVDLLFELKNAIIDTKEDGEQASSSNGGNAPV